MFFRFFYLKGEPDKFWLQCKVLERDYCHLYFKLKKKEFSKESIYKTVQGKRIGRSGRAWKGRGVLKMHWKYIIYTHVININKEMSRITIFTNTFPFPRIYTTFPLWKWEWKTLQKPLPTSHLRRLLSSLSILPMTYQIHAIQCARRANMDMSRVRTIVLCWE